MFNLPEHIKNLEIFYNSQQIILLTVEQLKKDFGDFSLFISFDSSSKISAYHQLYNEVYPHVEQMLHKNKNRLYSLLYRIDINEIAIKKFSKEFPHMQRAEIITELILQREMKKVLTRLYFKGA